MPAFLKNSLRGVVFLVFGGILGAAPIDALSTDSPFLPKKQAKSANASSSELATAEEAAVVEFRGMITTNEGTFFGLYDSNSQESMWVRQGVRTEGNVLVKDYDKENDSIALEYKGQSLNLALASAVITVSKPTVKEPRSNKMNGAAQRNRRAAFQGRKGAESERLRAIADEVRSRRAMRLNSQPGNRSRRSR